ncbi:hypothetical protein [Blastococcus atacamensis]|uniref:hypothetical protein n=1 Tax=Blastococcus atacamensis TaxID=2070508 RepID=UPI000CEBB554|nr:hypothetical protein [Blastococcus atacamensis]
MGAGISRRTFFLGTAVFAMALSAAYALILTVLAAAENATDGWGLSLYFWSPGGIVVENPALLALIHCTLLVLAATVGLGAGAIYKRWGTTGIYVASAAIVVLGGAGMALIGSLDSWGTVFDWFGAQPASVVAVGIPLVLVVLLGALTHATIRRAVP